MLNFYIRLKADSSHRLSIDMVRTKTFDTSANLLNPSLSFGIYKNVTSLYGHIDHNAYCTPFDRIGRNYTSSAVALTMKEASKIAKLAVQKSSPTKNQLLGVNLSATAPEAFEAAARITEIAHSPSGKSPPKRPKVEYTKPLPSVGSPQALRETHRLIRSNPAYTIKEPRGIQFHGDDVVKDFDSWDPVSIDEVTEADEVKSSGPEAEKNKLEQKSDATKKYWEVVQSVIANGVETATGSGQRRQVSSIMDSNIESIITRVPTIPGFLNSDHLKNLLAVELSEVRAGYVEAVARASVEYSIRDNEFAKEVGINRAQLLDSSIIELWTNKEFQLAEWRVLRQTGVEKLSVLRSFHRMDKNLCTNLPIMLELQYLWLDNTLPTGWWENMSSTVKCTYSGLLFVDVNQPKFRSKLPFLMDDFTMHLETYAKDIRDALIEYWIVSAGGKLSNCISQLTDVASKNSELYNSNRGDGLLTGQGNDFTFGQDGERESDDEASLGTEQFRKFKEKNSLGAMNNRMTLEGFQSKGGKKGATTGGTLTSQAPSNFASGQLQKPKKNRAEAIVDCGVVLMSRQLRSMCESSLYALADLFEKLQYDYTAQYSIFVINIKLRKVKSREISLDFNEPVEVCLQPELSEIKNAVINSINTIVNTSRGYSRPEQR